jgi:hypothetical protein
MTVLLLQLAKAVWQVLWRAIGWKGVIILALIAAIGGQRVFYEGVSLPWFGHVVDGRVQSYAANQVAIAKAQATAICNGKLEKLVSGADLAAANARVDLLQRELIAMQQLKEQADKDAADMDQKAQDAQHALDQKNTADKPGDDRSHWTAADLEYMQPSRPAK